MSEYAIHVVGCGSLGSTFGEEMAKKSFATDKFFPIHLYDFDKVEKRNVAAQNFKPSNIGQPKVEVVGNIIETYGNKVFRNDVKVTDKNWETVMNLTEKSILVCCVDNLRSRQLIDLIGFKRNIPVLQLGMRKVGDGNVQWGFKSLIYPLSLSVFTGNVDEIDQKEEENSLPPCELNELRGLIFNTSLMGVIAVSTLIDPTSTKYFKEYQLKDEYASVFVEATTTCTGIHFTEIREERWDASSSMSLLSGV